MVSPTTADRHVGPVEVIGVPFDEMGRPGGQAGAPTALETGCSGWSLSVYNPDKDEAGVRHIVDLVLSAFAQRNETA